VTNILEQNAQDQADAAYMQHAGALAMQGGEISAGADVLSALGKTDWSKFGLGPAPKPAPT
jgi:hypothetical protein